MKKIILVIMAILMVGFFVPKAGWSYSVTESAYNIIGQRAMAQTFLIQDYDKTTKNVTKYQQKVYYAGDLTITINRYADGRLDSITAYNYDGSKVLEAVTTGLTDSSLSYVTLFDGAGDELMSFYTEVVVDNKKVKIGRDSAQKVAILLGDTGGAKPRKHAVVGSEEDMKDGVKDGWETLTLSDADKDDLALLNWAGTLLRNLKDAKGNPIFTLGTGGLENFDTHSGMNFAKVSGKLIRSINLDQNGDGYRELGVNYGFTTNIYDHGEKDRYAIYATDITMRGALGTAGVVSVTGNFQGTQRQVTSPRPGRVEITDPSKFHNVDQVNNEQRAAWDPAVDLTGTLGHDANGFFINVNGKKYNLDIQDSNAIAELMKNVGKQITAHGDLDKDLLMLQNYSVI